MSDPAQMAASNLDELLGLTYEAMSGDQVTAFLLPDDRHRQPFGLIHGGVYCSIVESLGSVGSSLYAMEHGMLGSVGVSNSTDFLRSHRDGRLNAVATPIHSGRTQQLWLVEISRASDDTPVARGQLRTYNLASGDEIGGMTG
jgi:uncharacterized protein (TIGR00369 family)